MSVCADLSMATGSCGVCVKVCLVWRLGVLSAFGDVSVVVSTGGGTVWVEVWLVCGRISLSTGDEASCTESVIVHASIVATLG